MMFNSLVTKKIPLILAGAALMAFGAAGSAKALSFSDSFDAESNGFNSTEFANWDVTSGSVDVIGSGFDDLLPGNGNYVDLDGSTNAGGTLTTKQTFLLDPGEYLLEFALAGSQRGDSNQIVVNLGSIYSEVLTVSPGDPFTTFSRLISVSSATSGQLSFTNAGGDNIGALLDNVSLNSNAQPIPTPALLPGLIGMGMATLRKHKSQPVKAAVDKASEEA